MDHRGEAASRWKGPQKDNLGSQTARLLQAQSVELGNSQLQPIGWKRPPLLASGWWRRSRSRRFRGILSLHPCRARCGARHRCELGGLGRCRARSSWRVLFTASRTPLSSPFHCQSPIGHRPAMALPRHRSPSRPKQFDWFADRNSPSARPVTPLRQVYAGFHRHWHL